MAIRPIIELGNPILRQPSRPVKQDELQQVYGLTLDMYDTLLDFRNQMGYGRGIVASQVGVAKRVVVLQHQGMPLVLINPKFTHRSEEMFVVWDSCFSYPGIWFQVRRHRQVNWRNCSSMSWSIWMDLWPLRGPMLRPFALLMSTSAAIGRAEDRYRGKRKGIFRKYQGKLNRQPSRFLMLY